VYGFVTASCGKTNALHATTQPLAGGSGVLYCEEYVDLFVCLYVRISVHWHVSKITHQALQNFPCMLPVTVV